MPEKFIGAEIRAGQFEAKDTGKKIDYNNLILCTVKETECGEITNDTIKIANTAQNIMMVFGEMISMKWLKERLGWYIDVFYNKYKKPERVLFYKTNPITSGYDGLVKVPQGITDYTPKEVASDGMPDFDDVVLPDKPEETATTEEAKTEKGGKK